jgi:hypothetical protein
VQRRKVPPRRRESGYHLPQETAIRQGVIFTVFSSCFGALALTACGGGAAAISSGQDAASTTTDAGEGEGGVPGADSGATDGAGAGAAVADGPFVPAPHPPLPQVMNSGGPVVAAPKVLPILYMGDPGASDVGAFLDELTRTAYWGETTSEYGVGPLTLLPTVTLPEVGPPMVSDAELQAMLVAGTSGATPAFGAADPSTIYTFVLPAGTVESDTEGACCTDFDGYHSETTGGPIALPYVVACACPGFGGPDSALHLRTIAISHELVETATDPFPHSNPAFLGEDYHQLVWTFVTGGELADMCVLNEDAYFIPPGSQYMIQRSWSNAAAEASADPCVPTRSSGPYFNTFPTVGPVSYAVGIGRALTTQGVKIPLGTTLTIPLILYSSAPTEGDWTVRVFDANDIKNGSPNLTLSLDRTTGHNGDTINLTITPNTKDARLRGEAFLVFSELGTPHSGTFRSSTMMGLVTN